MHENIYNLKYYKINFLLRSRFFLAGHFFNKSWKIGEWQDCNETVKRQSVIAKIHITVAKT